jgi:3D (Asp-Asp-Asp) domain-containing protein
MVKVNKFVWLLISVWGIIVSMIILFQAHLLSTFTLSVSNFNSTIEELNNEITFLKARIEHMHDMYKIKQVKTLTVTAYSPTKRETDSDPYINASMQPVREGTIAVSRDLFDEGWVFGKKVYVKNYGIFEIADLMNERYTDRIDIFMFSTKQAKRFGVKTLKVALLDI